MKLRQLESFLSEVDTFDEPSIDLEQISTPAHLAARMIFTASETYDDIIDKDIADFGCGPGILSIGSSIMGSSMITDFDVDIDALKKCKSNIDKLDIENIDLVQADISTLSIRSHFDTIVMNPPFGTRYYYYYYQLYNYMIIFITKRNAGIDTAFVEKGLEYADVVYSLHKTSTR